jgi:hypothetical protein
MCTSPGRLASHVVCRAAQLLAWTLDWQEGAASQQQELDAGGAVTAATGAGASVVALTQAGTHLCASSGEGTAVQSRGQLATFLRRHVLQLSQAVFQVLYLPSLCHHTLHASSCPAQTGW